MHPKDAKILLAKTIIEQYHPGLADSAAERWIHEVSRRNIPSDIPATNKTDLLSLLAEVSGSKSSARRLLSGSAVSVNGAKTTDERLTLSHNDIIKVGKQWRRVEIEQSPET